MRLVVQPEARSGWESTLIRIGSVLLAFILSAVFLLLTDKDPAMVFGALYEGAFGSVFGFSETLIRTVPLLLCGLGVSLAARMQLWNIGAEGQLYMGAAAASGVALACPDMSPFLLLPLMALAGMVAGGLWGLVPGALRAYTGTNETITTLLLNYVAISWVSYLVYGPWKDPKGYNFPLTPRFSSNAWLPLLWGRVHIGLLIALGIAVLIWLIPRVTRWGYEIRIIGNSPVAARYSGMSIVRNILLVMFTAGALAGLAGMMEVSGLLHRLQKDVSPGYGYSAIIVAYLAHLNPFALILVAFLFGGLQAGGYSVQRHGVPLASTLMIQGIILFTVLAGEFLTRNRVRMVWRKEAAES